MSSMFGNFIMLCVILNTITLATDGLIEDSPIINKMGFAFTYIFTLEMIIKLLGFGVVGYVKDKMNCFDAFIVILSLVEMIVT